MAERHTRLLRESRGGRLLRSVRFSQDGSMLALGGDAAAADRAAGRRRRGHRLGDRLGRGVIREGGKTVDIDVDEVGVQADAVVVGSAIVNQIAERIGQASLVSEVAAYVKSMVKAGKER